MHYKLIFAPAYKKTYRNKIETTNIMKLIFTRTMMTLLLVATSTLMALAQKEISGRVFNAGEAAGGVEVSAHKGTSAYSNHKGEFTITIEEKCKYIKFTDLVTGKASKLNLEGNEESPVLFSLDGSEIPSAMAAGIDMRSQKELVEANVMEYMESVTMYDQAYKHKEYKNSLRYWRKVYDKYPKSSKNIYIQGVTMYKQLLLEASTKQEALAYVDTISQIYVKRMEMFGDEGFVKGLKGGDYYANMIGLDLSDKELLEVLKVAYSELSESVNLAGNETTSAVLVYYMGVSKALFQKGGIAKADVVENYGKASAIIEAKLSKDPADEQTLTVQEEVNKAFQTSGAADCEALASYYKPRFNDIVKSEEDLKKMIRALDRQRCTDSDLYAKAAEAMYELSPSAEAAFNMARLFVKREKIDVAKEYYKRAIDNETDKELLAKYYYELALFTLSKDQAYAQAKAYVNKAIENNSQYGEAYLLLGDIYAQGAKSYSSDAFERSTVYWVAVDKYTKAKSVNSELATEANRKIGTYRAYFPDNEILFFQGLNSGSAYTVGGWIGEKTSVRAK